MDSNGSALKSRITSPRGLLILSVLIVLACAPSVARAREDGWHLEFGFGARPVFAFGGEFEALGPSGAVESDIHLVRNSGGLGVRFEIGAIGLYSPNVEILGIPSPFIPAEPVPLSVGLEQTATLWALGPAWCFPLRRGRVEVYVLAGAVQTITTVMEPEYDSGWLTWSASWPYGLPKGSESEAAPLVIVGSSWSGGRARLWRFGFGFEVGAELQMTGQAPALDDPPIQFDGAHYELRTRSVAMNCAALRFGFNWLGYSRKR
jgi:hypothetical protein